MADTIDNEADRKLRASLNVVTIKYKELLIDMAYAAEERNRGFPSLAAGQAQDCARNADKRALTLYTDAESHMIPASTDTGTSARKKSKTKQKKLKATEYAKAAVYATRVRIDAWMVLSHGYKKGDERKRYLDKLRRFVNDVVERLRGAAEATVKDTSLLEMALDYHLPLATYVMLIVSLQTTIKMVLEPPGATNVEKIQWDDGLSQIR